MDMRDTRKASESIVVAMVRLLDDGDFISMRNPFRARQICVPDRKARLNIAMAMPCTTFAAIHPKFDTRRMDAIHGSGPLYGAIKFFGTQ